MVEAWMHHCWWRRTGVYVDPMRCETSADAWAGHLTHGPSPPRQTARSIGTSRDYRTGENSAGISSLLSCRIGRTPVWGGHGPPAGELLALPVLGQRGTDGRPLL